MKLAKLLSISLLCSVLWACNDTGSNDPLPPNQQLLGEWRTVSINIKNYEEDNLLGENTIYFTDGDYNNYNFYDYTSVIISYKNDQGEGKDTSIYGFDGDILYLNGVRNKVRVLDGTDLQFINDRYFQVNGVDFRNVSTFNCTKM